MDFLILSLMTEIWTDNLPKLCIDEFQYRQQAEATQHKQSTTTTTQPWKRSWQLANINQVPLSYSFQKFKPIQGCIVVKKFLELTTICVLDVQWIFALFNKKKILESHDMHVRILLDYEPHVLSFVCLKVSASQNLSSSCCAMKFSHFLLCGKYWLKKRNEILRDVLDILKHDLEAKSN